MTLIELQIRWMQMDDVRKGSTSFRSWFYFRTGWSVYFAFIFAAINTLVVTYYLAIENIPILQQVFPTFTHYIIATILVGIPVLIGVGYIHFKKSQAFKAESDDPRSSLSYKLRKILDLSTQKLFCSDEYIKNDNFVSKEELIKKSDIIILGVPHNNYSGLKIPKSKYVYDMWDFLK